MPFARGTITQCVDANQGGLYDFDVLFSYILYSNLSHMDGNHMKIHHARDIPCSTGMNCDRETTAKTKLDDANIQPRIPWFELWQKLYVQHMIVYTNYITVL